MTNVLSPRIVELLNFVVDGQIRHYEVNYEEMEFQGDNFLGELMFVSLKNKDSKKNFELVVKQAPETENLVNFFIKFTQQKLTSMKTFGQNYMNFKKRIQ